MTLPPEKIGDLGQRYEAQVLGYPKEGWNTVGFSDRWGSANRLGKTLAKAPGATEYRVVDRRTLATDEKAGCQE